MMLPHFQDPDRLNPVSSGDRLPTQIYSQALDHLVIACVDIVLTYQTKIFLAKRSHPPRPSWWILGGRMVAGEAPLAAASRKIREEAALNVSSDRLQFVGVYSTCFADRQQPPQQNGLHSLNITYQVELATIEKAHLKLAATEYEQGEWMLGDRIRSLLNEQVVMDRALLQIIQDIRRRSLNHSAQIHPTI
jgi:ADP-ribose pyrophosphatase YjhB (NUDIX family)